MVALRPVVASDVAAFSEHRADRWERTLADGRLGADVAEARCVLDR